MSKKHYIAIAEIIGKERRKHKGSIETIFIFNDIINGLAKYFKDDNPKFNKELFIKETQK